MLLKDFLIKAGDICFKNRSFQYLPYLFVILFGFHDLKNISENIPFELLCCFVTLLGLSIRATTIGYVFPHTSGRNRKKQIAERLNTTGMYSIVRNPLYVGNFLIFLGIIMMAQSWRIVLINSVFMAVFYTLIVLKEEDFLEDKFQDEYRKWAEKTNCFLPSFKNYQKNECKFSMKKVIRNEHDTWLSTFAAFIGMEIVCGYFETNTFYLIPVWSYTIVGVFFVWAVSKVLKKSKLLDENERIYSQSV